MITRAVFAQVPIDWTGQAPQRRFSLCPRSAIVDCGSLRKLLKGESYSAWLTLTIIHCPLSVLVFLVPFPWYTSFIANISRSGGAAGITLSVFQFPHL
jgi:hypothetical protein